MASNGRSFAASVVGWLIFAIVVVVFFGGLLSFIAFLVRAALFIVLIGVLLTLYFRLRDG
ncbi:MAG: hypothetical protein HKN44_13890 [Ilumatobacter sp.]|nr:hypothetical protein [Ilumatobacter sp.]